MHTGYPLTPVGRILHLTNGYAREISRRKCEIIYVYFPRTLVGMLKASAETTRVVFAVMAGGMAILAIALRLRALPFSADPSLCASVETIGAFLTFTFTANALVRFRGTRDRIALILAMGFSFIPVFQQMASRPKQVEGRFDLIDQAEAL